MLRGTLKPPIPSSQHQATPVPSDNQTGLSRPSPPRGSGRTGIGDVGKAEWEKRKKEGGRGKCAWISSTEVFRLVWDVSPSMRSEELAGMWLPKMVVSDSGTFTQNLLIGFCLLKFSKGECFSSCSGVRILSSTMSQLADVRIIIPHYERCARLVCNRLVLDNWNWPPELSPVQTPTVIQSSVMHSCIYSSYTCHVSLLSFVMR